MSNIPENLKYSKSHEWVLEEDGVFTIGLTGDGGGRMAPLCDILLAVGHPSTPLVQETHAAIGHMLCALTDYYLFENVMAIKPMLD